MATSYTSLLGLALPVTGELQGTWGTTVNDEITSLLDSAVAGTTTLNTDADVVLTTSTGAANQARQAIILWTANGTTTRNITAPAQSKAYIVVNASAGTQSIVIRGAGPTTGVTVAKGEKVVVAWNGSDFVRVAAYGGTGEFTTVDTTNIEVTNIKAKDGTASASIADATGVVSFSANPVLSGGTANGVSYLNASKVLTTGSALTFSGTQLAVTGSVSSSNSGNENYFLSDGSTRTSLQQSSNALYYNVNDNSVSTGSFIWRNTSAFSELMRLTSTGLGIGTSSPVQKLTVAGGLIVTSSATLPAAAGSSILLSYEAPISRLYFGDGTGYSFAFSKRSASVTTDLLTLTDTGNLGLGLTPSAWGTGAAQQAAQVSLAALSYNGALNTASRLTHNAYFDGTNWRYISSAIGATRYEMTGANAGSTHSWSVSAGGTAGNAISFTQAMTLDASGNLGVGTSSPGFRLDLGSGTGGIGLAQTDFSHRIVTSGSVVGTEYHYGAGTVYGYNYANATGYNINAKANVPLVLHTNNTERARITSGGDLLVGTTDSSFTTGAGLKFTPSATAPNFGLVGSDSANTSVTYRLYSTGAAAYRFYVGYGGTVYATSTTITGISDARLKENVRDLDDGLSSVMALKPRKFDWKAGKGKDIKDDRGFIAQEFEQVFPDMIDEWKDPAPEGEAPYKAVNANLIPTLVRAIQEQQALITDLRARVAALETP